MVKKMFKISNKYKKLKNILMIFYLYIILKVILFIFIHKVLRKC
jgi:hypothetical protein